jgi:hypothetical protein
MKKLLYLFIMLIMGSCTCSVSIAQIPTQYLYIDESCGAALPDYLTKIEVTDNCGISSIEQTPSPGSWLTAPTTTVLIRAIDIFGNTANMMFNVTLIDTIKPVIKLIDSTLITQVYTDIDKMYDLADRMLAYQDMWFDSVFPWDSVRIQYTDEEGNLQVITGIPDELIPSNLYFNRTMVTWTAEGHAFNGEGMRVFTFVNPGDTLIVQ